MRSAFIGSQKSRQRDRWWYLHQSDDGSLWISYDDDSDKKGWTKPLHEVLASGPKDARTRAEAWIGQTLEEGAAQRA